MNKIELEKMADLESDYWWHKGKVCLIKDLIETYFPGNKQLKILEIGCGTGGLTKHLLGYGQVTALDISPLAVEYCKKSGVENVFVQDIVNMDVSSSAGTYDLILALDVLEHIQEDVLAMQNMNTLLNEKGLAIINVPAHKFLWSEHDEALEHKRRYHSLELIKKLNDANFEIIRKNYFVCLIAPIIVIYRIWGNIFGKSAYPKTSYVLLPKKINDLFVEMLKWESKISKKFSLPFGVTLNVVARPIKK